MKINEQEFNKSIKHLKGVQLTESEKASMLSSIYQTEIIAATLPVVSPFIFSSFFTRERVMVVMASFVLIVFGGGYAAAAGSLPGDPLYGIKVNVLEPLTLQLTFGEVAKNEYKVELLQRRIAELEELRLNTDVNLASEEESYHAAERNVAELEASAIFNEDGINVDVETSIDTYNSLISEPYRLETKIMKGRVIPTSEEDETDEGNSEKKDEETILQKNTGQIEGTVTEVIKTLDEIDREIEEAQSATEETVENIKEVTTPLTESLGF